LALKAKQMAEAAGILEAKAENSTMHWRIRGSDYPNGAN
jgi:hypothetical protein